MKLYDGGRAPNPRRVRIFLAEKGIELPLVPIDIGAMDQRGQEFTALNPLQQVPVLELDDGTIISESIAICRYFEELQPEPTLFGTGALERAMVEMWQRRVEFHLFQPVTAVFRHSHPAMKEVEVPQVPQWAEANKPKAASLLRFLDAELATRPFIAGETFSVADITAFVAVQFMKPAKVEIPAGLTHLDRWFNHIAARPSANT